MSTVQAFWAGFGVATMMFAYVFVWALCTAAGDADSAIEGRRASGFSSPGRN